MIMDNRFLVARRRYDPDATRYINAVQLADGQALEPEVAMAVDAFVRGCKADSAGYAGDPTRTVWDALQASCIMCGARTISGALVPLVGPSPTAYPQPVNFVSADYDRSSGLKGDGSTKYLDTNRANNADGQDDRHASVYATTLQTTSGLYIDGQPSGGSLTFVRGQGTVLVAPINGPYRALGSGHTVAGLLGASRSNSTLQLIRGSGIQQQLASDSVEPPSRSVFVFGPTVYSDARLAFYSIGGGLDLAALDNRVSTLVAAIAAAIP